MDLQRFARLAVMGSLAIGLVAAPAIASADPASAPGPVTHLQVTTKTSTSISLSWSAPAGDPAAVDDYDVIVATAGSATAVTHDIGSTSGTYTVTGLEPDRGYDISVAAVASGVRGAKTVLGGATSLSAGSGDLCATDDVGQVTCWGADDLGQLGNGTTSQTPATVGVHPRGIGLGAPASSVSVGDRHVCALMVDQTVRCWGNNLQGQLGDRTFAASAHPVQASGVAGAVGVATSGSSTCAALGADGVKCWGGFVDNGGISTPTVPEGFAGLSASAATPGYWPCVVEAGRAICRPTGSQTDPQDLGFTNVSALSGADETWGFCALSSGGAVQCQSDGYPEPVEGISDATDISVGDYSACAALADGTVSCWGTPVGEANDEPQGSNLQATPVPGISGAVAVAVAPSEQDDSSGGVSYACAALNTGEVKCWGANAFDAAADNATVASSFYDAEPAPVYTGAAPSASAAAPTVVAHPSPSTARLRWSAPASNGGSEIADYRIQTQVVGSSSWSSGQDFGDTALSGTVGGLTEGGSYRFRVEAFNSDGWGSPSEASAEVTAESGPLAPTLTLESSSGSKATLSWVPAADDGGQPVTGYDIQTSLDNGATWQDAAGQPEPAGATTATIDGLDATGTAYLLRVIGINALGSGAPSASVVVDTAGTSDQQLTIVTSDGQPVSGALVSWQSQNDTSASDHAYVTNADGVVTFPRVVPGSSVVEITGGLLPDAATVSGSWRTVIGTNPQTLSVSREPAFVTRKIDVTMPNGVPVLAASGTIQYSLEATAGNDGFRFVAPGGGTLDNVSGDDGVITFVGYPRLDYLGRPLVPTAVVEYDDGTLVQKQTVQLASETTDVQLAYMPWVTVTTSSANPTVGSSVAVRIRVRQPASVSRPALAKALSSAARSRISITPPAGATSKACRRASKLSGSPSSSGLLNLRICASRSGVYRVVSHGAVPAPGFLLLVRGAAPLAPRNVEGRSFTAGQVRLSWGIPTYSGGARVTGYRITATAAGRKAVRLTNHGATHLVVRGLSRFANWTFHVSAVTKFGAGPSTSGRVRVS